MKIISREKIFEGDYLNITRKTALSAKNERIDWEIIDRNPPHNRGASLVIGITGEGDVILEKQWRASIESYIIQFPGGLVDTETETKENTAGREFFEETGYIVKRIIPLADYPAFPVLTPMHDRYFFAPEVEYKGGNVTDAEEEIEVITVPVKDLYRFLSELPDNTEVDLRVPGIIWILEKKGLI